MRYDRGRICAGSSRAALTPSALPVAPDAALVRETSVVTEAAAPRRRASRLRRFGIGALLFLVALLGVLWWIGVFGGNVHEVVPGGMVRSAQLTDDTLRRTMDRYRIASVVNLRGEQAESAFYRSETEICRERGVPHRDVALSAYTLPPPSELHKLLSAFEELPKPILIHCRAGADRTGLAATMYAHLYGGVPLNQAQSQQLGIHYGHFPMGAARAMDEFFDLFRKTGGGQTMDVWIDRTYPALYARLVPRGNHDRAAKSASE